MKIDVDSFVKFNSMDKFSAKIVKELEQDSLEIESNMEYDGYDEVDQRILEENQCWIEYYKK